MRKVKNLPENLRPMARLGNCGGGSNTGSLTSKEGFSEPVYNEKYIQWTLINHLSTSSKDLNDMPHYAAFHQVLHYLLFKGNKTKLCIIGAHLQCVNNHYAKFEYKGVYMSAELD